MNNEHSTNKVFNQAYEVCEKIEFNPSWKNGTGYFDNATRENIPVGERRSCEDPTTQRRLILIGTPMGTVVVFERYRQGDNGIFVSNWPSDLEEFRSFFGTTSAHSADTLSRILGQYEDENIGTELRDLKEVLCAA